MSIPFFSELFILLWNRLQSCRLTDAEILSKGVNRYSYMEIYINRFIPKEKAIHLRRGNRRRLASIYSFQIHPEA